MFHLLCPPYLILLLVRVYWWCFILFCFALVLCVWMFCLCVNAQPMCAWCPQISDKRIRSSGTKISNDCNHYVSAGNWTQVILQEQVLLTLNHLPSLPSPPQTPYSDPPKPCLSVCLSLSLSVSLCLSLIYIILLFNLTVWIGMCLLQLSRIRQKTASVFINLCCLLGSGIELRLLSLCASVSMCHLL